MGAQYSYLEIETLTPWRNVQFGLHYSSLDLAVWPQFYPLAMCFTANDAICLRDALRHRPQTSVLTLDEFIEWIQTSKSHPTATQSVLRRGSTRDEGKYFHDLTSPAPHSLGSQARPVPPPPTTFHSPTASNYNSNDEKTISFTSSTGCLANSSQLLDSYVEYIFESFKSTIKTSTATKSSNTSTGEATTTTTTSIKQQHKVFAMEFLAAMTIISKPIWRLEDKIRVLVQLFEQRFTSKFRLGDLAHLFFCVMQGIAKVTIGVAQVWHRQEIDASKIAKELALECLESIRHPPTKPSTSRSTNTRTSVRGSTKIRPGTRSSTSIAASTNASTSVYEALVHGEKEREAFQTLDHDAEASTQVEWMTSDQVQRFFVQKRVLNRFLSLFSGEEVRNPWSFSTSRNACGFCMGPEYARVMQHQQQLYSEWSLATRKTSLYGRLERRQHHAATLIQSCWRRKFSKLLLEQACRQQLERRDQSAKKLQNYLKNCNMSKLLSRHAFVEKCAYNGGVLVTGTGPCIGKKKPRKSRSKFFPLELIDYFKLREKKCTLLAMSKHHAIALDDKGHQLYAWGRSLPCAISSIDSTESCVDPTGLGTNESRNFLNRPVPVPLVVTGIPVKQLACGVCHCLLLDQYGMLYSWGFNDHGQTGHGPSRIFQARKKLMTTHHRNRVVRQQCDNNNNNESSVERPTNEEMAPAPVGYLSYYDPKLGVEYEYLDRPVRLLYFEGSPQQHADPIPLQQICCGDYYSMALSVDGEVFCWGDASEGQLGLGVMDDTMSQLEVGFCDQSVIQSAFTFVPQPEPVVALNGETIVQIVCNGNHSMALSKDSRIFEWGNWGKRKGKDLEHAFEPLEIEQVTHLRLTKLAAGQHHTIAEGSSVWLCLDNVRPRALNRPVQEVYVALAKFACGFGEIQQRFVGRKLTCVVIDNDLDDLDVEPKARHDVDGGKPGFSTTHQDAQSVKHSVWYQRIEPFTLDFDAIGTQYDMKAFDLLPLVETTNKFSTLIELLYTDQCNRLVMIPRGATDGYYVQCVLPVSCSTQAAQEEPSIVDADAIAGQPPTTRRVRPHVVEFLTCASKQAQELITKRGFGTHVAVFANALHQESLIANSLCLIWIDESCTEFVEAHAMEEAKQTVPDCGHADSFRVPAPNNDQDQDAAAASSDASCSKGSVSWGDLLIQAINHRVMMAQEMGAIAALIVLDFLDTDPFELDFGQHSGVFIPVVMLKKTTRVTFPRVPSTSPIDWTDELERKWTNFGQFYEDCLDPDGSSSHGNAASGDKTHLQVRCFHRLDTLPFRIAKAFECGACGVLVVQDKDAVELDGETRGAPVFLSSTSTQWEQQLQQSMQRFLASFESTCSSSSSCASSSYSFETTNPLPFVGMLSYASGEIIRHACRLSDHHVVLSSYHSSSQELLADVSLQIKPGGSLYAWGNGENGRLGLGANDKPPFEDGYEAFTDSAYRFVDKPSPIPGLGGIPMRQICCGSAHSIALSQDGKVYCWGRGKNGECGFAVPQDQYTPRQLHRLRFERIVQVAANDKCSAFVCEITSPEVYQQRRKEIAHLRATGIRQPNRLPEN